MESNYLSNYFYQNPNFRVVKESIKATVEADIFTTKAENSAKVADFQEIFRKEGSTFSTN